MSVTGGGRPSSKCIRRPRPSDGGADRVYPVSMAELIQPEGRVTRLLTRFTMDADGRLRGMRLLGIAFVGGLVVAIGTTAAIVVADAGNPATLSIWVIVAFLGVKLPLLGVLWWILGRRQRDEEPTDAELRMMMVRLEAGTDAALRTPDAHDRLEILRDEAWFVSDRASADLKPQAVELALRLDELAHAATPGSGNAPHH